MNKRDIKFRAWDKMENIMCKVYEIDFRDEGGIETNHYIGSFGRYELMQYTGLKDKNGKEIYEGDIVNAYWPWEGTQLQITCSSLEWVFGFNFKEMIKEVIGNIYQNPELLKEDKE